LAKVLIVEDDPDQLEIYARLLYYNGFDVDLAHDSEQAVTLARRNAPDAILMDVILPGRDGITTASLLKAAKDTASIPIICMSAYDVSRERALHAGCAAVLRKPVDGHDLVLAIRRQIGWLDPEDPAPQTST
jgi:DNA-binding response OmpR family regulator